MHHESENLRSDIPFRTYFSAYGAIPYVTLRLNTTARSMHHAP